MTLNDPGRVGRDQQPWLVANATPTLAALADDFRPLLAGIKVGDWVDGSLEASLRAAYPACVFLFHHWHLYTTPDQAPDGALTLLQDALTRYNSPWLSAHIDQVSWAEILPIFREGVIPPRDINIETAIERNCVAARLLQSGLPVPLLLENMPHWPHDVLHEAVRPAFIRAVLEAADAPLLLDLAHARVSAAALAMPVEAYLSALPLDRVVEIHLSGPRMVDGRLVDAHEPLTAEDYDLLAWALARTDPRAVTLEYSQPDAEALRVMVQQLARTIAASN